MLYLDLIKKRIVHLQNIGQLDEFAHIVVCLEKLLWNETNHLLKKIKKK